MSDAPSATPPAVPEAASCRGCGELRVQLESARRRILFLEALLDEVPLPLFGKDGAARFTFFNKAYEEFFDADRRRLLRLSVLDLDYLPEEERRRYQAEDEAMLRELREIHYETSYETSRGHRDALYWSKGFRVRGSEERGLIGAIVDISREKNLERELADKVRALERAQQELRRIIRTDPLTSLPNRRMLEERLRHGIAIAGRHGLPLGVIMADIDHFKRVNDEHGHQAGDKVLRMFGEILMSSCRREDTPARVGGEEFAVVMPLTDMEGVRLAAERIREIVASRPVLPGGGGVTVSLGVAQYRSDEDCDSLMRRADEALYRAKNAGRNRVSE